ncbi:hypothetical protein [Microbacterium sp. MTN4-26]|uniref:hypothetical protein n=1 Tax=unclassified Microbacterium TaxID=2609290 RepID=UPI0036F27665|tara:strand:+ start:4091 stop:4261 length:171 start_codon:yes stop_codon:yes gene_type:complete
MHDGVTPTAVGEPVLCPFQPDGSPKPVVDHQGRIYRLMDSQDASDFFDYQLVDEQD